MLNEVKLTCPRFLPENFSGADHSTICDSMRISGGGLTAG